MVDNELREKINQYVDDMGFEETYFFDNPAYDKSIVGITSKGRIIYSYNKMVEELTEEFREESGEDAENDAIEFIEYNTLRAIPYFKEAPEVMYDLEEITERY